MSTSSYLDPKKLPRCPICNADVNSSYINSKNSYSTIGWFFWSMGVTAIPKKIQFYCENCNQELETLTDRELIKYFITYKRY